MKKNTFYRYLKEMVRRLSPRYTLSGTDNLPEGPCILVGNHAQIHGPVVTQLYLPGRNYTWCAGEMFHKKEVPAYAREDFWGQKPKWTRPFFYIASHVIAPLSVYIFDNADVIPVYRDARIMHTYRETVEKLTAGGHVVIFPEGHRPHNHIVADFRQGFTDVARIYSRKTGQEIAFVPMYVSPVLGKICFGRPEYSDRSAGREQERKRISGAMMLRITELAEAQPLHKVIPYENIPKKKYPMNRL